MVFGTLSDFYFDFAIDLAELLTPSLITDIHLIGEAPVPHLHLQNSGADADGFQSWPLFPAVSAISAIAPTQTPSSTVLANTVETLTRSESHSSTLSPGVGTLSRACEVPDEVSSTSPLTP